MTSKISPGMNRINLAEFKRQEWVATPEAGTTLEDLLRPDYWSHVAGRMKPMAIIEVFIEDMSAYYRLMVTTCNRVEARTILLYSKVLNEEEQTSAMQGIAETEEYEAKWQGPSSKFVMLRTRDKHVVKTGFSTKDEAEAYIRDYKQALAA